MVYISRSSRGYAKRKQWTTHYSPLTSLFIKVRAFPGHERTQAFQIFLFFHGSNDAEADKIWNILSDTKDFSFRINTEKKLSGLMYRVTFNEEEKKANEAKQTPVSMS